MNINKELKKYIINNIFPIYEKNEIGHKINHISYVIERCFELSKDEQVDINMLYVIASYHDIGYYIDYKHHEIISAKIMYEDDNLKKYFNEEQLKIMKEAIEDHRASLNREPRSIYGKLISSADRNIDIDESLKRIYFYSITHNNQLSEKETIEECYEHAIKKFGKENGYSKFFFKDEKYKNYLKELNSLLDSKEEFIKRLKVIIDNLKN